MSEPLEDVKSSPSAVLTASSPAARSPPEGTVPPVLLRLILMIDAIFILSLAYYFW